MTDHYRILAIDDDPEICRTLKMLFSLRGYEAECVLDAGSALVKLTNESFDLILTDLMMPGMSGIDLLRMIRRSENDIPVIVFTGRESLDPAIEAADLHVTDYLKKGTISGSELIEVVERALHGPPLG